MCHATPEQEIWQLIIDLDVFQSGAVHIIIPIANCVCPKATHSFLDLDAVRRNTPCLQIVQLRIKPTYKNVVKQIFISRKLKCNV